MSKVDKRDVRRRLEAGERPGVIASDYGVTVDAIRYHRKVFRLEPVYYRRCHHAALRELHSAGLTDAAIGERLGVSSQTVSAVRRGLGLKPNDARKSPEYKARMRERFGEQLASGKTRVAQIESVRSGRRALAGLYGLPGELTPVQVAIVLALCGGPLDADVLADRVGRRKGGRPGYTRFDYPQLKHGNYLADLRNRGLVFSVRQTVGSVYSLTPLAIDLLSGAANGQGRDGDGDAAGGGEAGAQDAAAE